MDITEANYQLLNKTLEIFELSLLDKNVSYELTIEKLLNTLKNYERAHEFIKRFTDIFYKYLKERYIKTIVKMELKQKSIDSIIYTLIMKLSKEDALINIKEICEKYECNNEWANLQFYFKHELINSSEFIEDIKIKYSKTCKAISRINCSKMSSSDSQVFNLYNNRVII